MSAGRRILELSATQNALLDAVMDGDADAVQRLTTTLTVSPIRLSAEILSTKRVGAGAGVSYGHRYVTTQPTTLALVSLGYGHGLPRKSGNAATVTWAEAAGAAVRTLPIVGRVAMDVLVIDADDAGLGPGESVVFFGDPATGESALPAWAALIGEDPVAVIAALDRRVRRQVRR